MRCNTIVQAKFLYFFQKILAQPCATRSQLPMDLLRKAQILIGFIATYVTKAIYIIAVKKRRDTSGYTFVILRCPYKLLASAFLDKVVDLMSEIYRVLKPGGRFLSFSSAFSAPAARRDQAHINIITTETFHLYLDTQKSFSKMYEFKGAFDVEIKSLSYLNSYVTLVIYK